MPVYVKDYIIYRFMNVLIIGKKPTQNGIIYIFFEKEFWPKFFFFHDVMKKKEFWPKFFFKKKWSSSMISVKYRDDNRSCFF